MKIQPLHSWDLTPTEAVQLQRQLANRVNARTPLTRWEIVAGADVSYNRFSNIFYAGVVVLRRSDGAIIEQQGAVREVTFPYVPGLLSFREAPVLLEALARVETVPDVVVLDGHGQAHPRRLGLAAHVGLWLDRPCIGCAKTLLTGEFKEPGARPRSRSRLIAQGEKVGYAVRTKARTMPVFVSVGNHIDLPSAVRVVLSSCRGYRLPEPTRQAHLYVNSLRRAGSESPPCLGLTDGR
jgi:deoxyribonuclease V